MKVVVQALLIIMVDHKQELEVEDQLLQECSMWSYRKTSEPIQILNYSNRYWIKTLKEVEVLKFWKDQTQEEIKLWIHLFMIASSVKDPQIPSLTFRKVNKESMKENHHLRKSLSMRDKNSKGLSLSKVPLRGNKSIRWKALKKRMSIMQVKTSIMSLHTLIIL